MSRRPQRRCEYCRQPVSPEKRPGAKYCSNRCRQAAHRERQARVPAESQRRGLPVRSEALGLPETDQRIRDAALAVAAVGLTHADRLRLREFGSRLGHRQWQDKVVEAKRYLETLERST
jgi:hypothetical protein